MRTVWKFETPVGQVTKHRAPWLHRHNCHVAVDNKTGVLCVWSEVMTDVPEDEWWVKTFIVVGTGHEIPENYVHRGTTQDGLFDWHVYELTA